MDALSFVRPSAFPFMNDRRTGEGGGGGSNSEAPRPVANLFAGSRFLYKRALWRVSRERAGESSGILVSLGESPGNRRLPGDFPGRRRE